MLLHKTRWAAKGSKSLPFDIEHLCNSIVLVLIIRSISIKRSRERMDGMNNNLMCIQSMNLL